MCRHAGAARADPARRGRVTAIAERLSAAHFSLQQALADVAAANAQKDAFLAIVSHDLKNPMSGIKGWAQLLRKQVARGDLAPAAFAQGLEAIEAAAANAAAMVDELIDLGRIGMGREIEIRPREIDLLPLLRDAVLLHQATATRHRLIFESADAGYVGSFDSTRLSRVFDNLITNAIHYSPAGGDIAITLRPVQRGPHVWAEIAVADPGLGIPDEDLPRVFERFYRGRNAAAIAGSGLGLAGARHIVEQHGGEIRVESTVGQGTTFTIRLPLAEAVAEG